MLQGEQVEEIIVRVRVEEKDSKLRPDKSMRHVQRPSQSEGGGVASGQPRGNKLYSFKDKHVASLFKLL